MIKLMVVVGTTVGGSVGWWLGAKGGLTLAFVLSTVGTGLGGYWGYKFARYLEE